MKVKLQIELEMENDGNNPIFTKEQMLNMLSIQESETVDGFEVTTDSGNTDNTNIFYIKPYSARIVSREMIDQVEEFRANQIDIQDFEIDDDATAVTSFIGTYFDVNKKFGVNVSADKGTWVNFYARYVPDSNELSCFYYVDREDSHSNAIEYFPTENEKELIISLMEDYCQKEENMSISEFVESVNNAINMSM